VVRPNQQRVVWWKLAVIALVVIVLRVTGNW
jgi:hypothetical protein